MYYQCIREHQNSPISYLAKRSTLLQHRVPFAFSMAFVVPWCHLSGTGAFSIRTSTRFSTEPYRLRSCRPPSRGRTAPCRFIHGQAEVREPDCRVSRSRRGVRPSGDTPGGADCEPGTAGSSRSYPVRSAHAGAFHEWRTRRAPWSTSRERTRAPRSLPAARLRLRKVKGRRPIGARCVSSGPPFEHLPPVYSSAGVVSQII